MPSSVESVLSEWTVGCEYFSSTNIILYHVMICHSSYIPIRVFVNRSIADWNQLPTGVIGTDHGNTHNFKTRVRKMLTGEGKYRC